MKITCEYDVKNDQIENLTVSCLEGGYSPWLHQFKLKQSTFKTPADSAYPWYGHADFYGSEFEIDCLFDNPKESEEDESSKAITQADFKKGLEIMATKYAGHFSDIITDNTDAITGDVFMQCVIFGEIIYG